MQVLNHLKVAVIAPPLDDPSGERWADARECLQFGWSGSVQVDRARCRECGWCPDRSRSNLDCGIRRGIRRRKRHVWSDRREHRGSDSRYGVEICQGAERTVCLAVRDDAACHCGPYTRETL